MSTAQYVSPQASRQPKWSCPKCLKNCSCSYCRKVTPWQLTFTSLTNPLFNNCISFSILVAHPTPAQHLNLLHFNFSLALKSRVKSDNFAARHSCWRNAPMTPDVTVMTALVLMGCSQQWVLCKQRTLHVLEMFSSTKPSQV